jgi:hypothetical protein
VVAVLAAIGLAACSTTPAASSGHPGTGSGGPIATSPSTGSGGHGNTGTSTTTVPPNLPSTSSIPAGPGGLAVTPADVKTIVANDTAINNKANGTLSIPLQDSHETCLQDLMDDYNFRGLQAAGQKSSGPPFQQLPGRAFVARQTSYPAYFSVLTKFVAPSSPNTDNLLTYIKESPSSPWKLELTSQILGPKSLGVTVPQAVAAGGGYTTTLAQGTAGANAAAGIASAFSTDARSGQLPSGFTAQWGPGDTSAPSKIRANYLGAGAATVTYSAQPPANTGIPAIPAALEGGCPSPVYRLTGGGSLAVLPIYLTLHVVAEAGQDLLQGNDRSQFGLGLEPGTYQSVTTEWGDVLTVVEPPAGSQAPIEVIGQGLEQLAATGISTGSILT